MADALQVEFSLLGIDKGIREMQRFARQMAQLQADTDIGMGRSGVSAASQALDLEKRRLQVVSQRQQIEIRATRQAWAEQKRMQANTGGSMGMGSLSRLVNSSRIGIGANGIEAMPLVGEMTKLLGEVSGPAGLAAGALGLLADASKNAAADMKAFAAMQFTGGGTKYETEFGRTLGGRLGMSGEDVAREARGFQERITSDPYAMSYANKYGFHDTPGPNGQLDRMTNLLNWIEKLRQMPEAEAMRAAHATGTDDFLPMREYNEGNWNAMKRTAYANSAAYTPEALARNANREAAMDNFKDMARGVYNGMGRAVNEDIDWLGRRIMSGTLRDRDIPPGFRDPLASGNGTNHQDRQTTAAERTANATEAIHQVLRAGRYGGGERAAGAIPEAYIGAGWATRQLTIEANRLGAFAL